MATTNPTRRTQQERRAASRTALVRAAAQGIARTGYTRLSLEEVARVAGYSRGALYHQFAGKEEVALAVVEWVDRTWDAEVGPALDRTGDPAELLLALAAEHARFCRRHDVARVIQVLRIEFNDPEHPVGRAIAATVAKTEADLLRLIRAGRRDGSIPPGPPATQTAQALGHALEAVSIGVAGAPYDVALAVRAARGILGLPAD
ncbi:TetR/AcrR family transcriptional regulator [Microlunatus parietis]|uniref:AcrR family transcriptional regulator n=1 Tax=Microlunatus parietis TaxID=682979 RepID=A0A7Y9I3T1_9ACTN|nr:TetR/AcrR family transcriptional regulator [Microlunatus parietis]NYE69699.1 AcrR family transcriptional regulator [Microlunatus parietis]